jgi:hypothetical protein
MKFLTIRFLATLLIAPLTLWLVPAVVAPAEVQAEDAPDHEYAPLPVQIVALDECDPTTFNAKLGPGFCPLASRERVCPFPGALSSGKPRREGENP